MVKLKDLIGLKFGKLIVISRVENKNNSVMWLCQCECGNKTIVSSSNLMSGNTKSCGCLLFSTKNKIHGMSNSKIYRVWSGIKDRCYCKCNQAYKNYGYRGIIMCDEWKNDFINFKNWAISNGYNDNLTIDRINVNGDYEPNNCRWVNNKIQARNTRTNKFITFNDETHCITEWEEILNLPKSIINQRINKLKWSIEKALTTPVKGGLQNG